MDFDRHCTSAARLAIITSLVAGGRLSFMELKKAAGLADGNLHVQAAKLTGDGYLERSREARGGRKLTYYRLTGKGFHALALHVRKLKGAIDSGMPVVESRKDPLTDDDSRVW